MAEGSDEERKHRLWPIVSPASLPFRSFTQPYNQNDLGVDWIFGFYSTSAFEWYQFLWDNRKKTPRKFWSFFQYRNLHRETAWIRLRTYVTGPCKFLFWAHFRLRLWTSTV